MKVLLVDSNNILMRAVFAADRVPLSANGVPTAALLIFINLLSRHIKEEQPTHVVVCWDGGRSTYRTLRFPAYKANRGERPEGSPDERGPFSQAKEFLTLAGIHHVERHGWEADDLIAAYWQNLRRDHPEAQIRILSADKDLLQLVDTHTEQVRPVSSGPTDRWDVARVSDKYGVAPRHVATAMALIGDIGDNVPGVKGIGPVKAAKMLIEHDFVLTRALEARPEDIEVALLSFDLVNLRSFTYGEAGLILPDPPAFVPTSFGGVLSIPLLRYLDRYLLEGIKSRLAARSLWYQTAG